MVKIQNCIICMSCEKHIVRPTGIKPCDDREKCDTYIKHQEKEKQCRIATKAAREREAFLYQLRHKESKFFSK